MARLIELADAINPAIINPIPGAGKNNIGAIPILRINRLGVGSTAAVLVVGVSAAMSHFVGNGGAVPVAIGVLVGHCRIRSGEGPGVLDGMDLVQPELGQALSDIC